MFTNCIYFHPFIKSSKDSFKSRSLLLSNLTITSLSDSLYTLMVTDANIKHNITISITHIHICNKDIIKTIHYAVNLLFTKTELIAIRCGINQATNIPGISKIAIITNFLHVARRIFDLLLYLYQKHTAAISHELRRFFFNYINNLIEFWECPSQCKWSLYKVMNIETKLFKLLSLFPCKLSWEFSKKSKCNNILFNWKITFQASDLKRQHFLELCDVDNNLLELMYTKGGSWLKYLKYSNSLYARVTRPIINYTQIGEYRLRYFLREDFSCLYGEYSIEMRHHILYKCKRFNTYWNSRRDSISYFILFLEFNSRTFSFKSAIT